MRNIFGEELYKLMKKDKSIVLLVGDIGYKIFDKIREEFPDRFFNLGLCEQSMVSISAGMALQGLKPYVYTITPFALERPYEFIKIDVVQQKQNVKIISYGDYPEQGVTHTTENSKEICETLKINYIKPKNLKEVKNSVKKMYNSEEPFFVHLTKNKDE